MSKPAARLALVFALVGLGASVAASYVHYRLLSDPLYTSFCDMNATISCTQVYQSRFSTFGGVPVALFGALWFVCAALLAVGAMVAPPSVRESIPGYLLALSTLALAVSLYLAYASIFILKAYCPLCLLTDAAVIGLFIVSGAAVSIPMTTLPSRAMRDLRVLMASPLAMALTLLFVAGAGTTLAFFPRETASREGTIPVATTEQRSELERFMATAPRIPLIIPAEGAKVLIVKFNDFQCPACGHSYTSYKPILAKYEAQSPGAVRLVLRDYPLNSQCNPNSPTTLHPAACDAAVAVRLARLKNRGEAMEDWLYTHQQGMTPATVRQAAREVGQVTDFEQKYAATLELVKGDIALGTQLGIHSTPTFFINGVKVEGEWAPQYFDQAIAYELQHAK
jgi:uncharacterized membrane protein/protein-disulfide isomerase